MNSMLSEFSFFLFVFFLWGGFDQSYSAVIRHIIFQYNACLSCMTFFFFLYSGLTAPRVQLLSIEKCYAFDKLFYYWFVFFHYVLMWLNEEK